MEPIAIIGIGCRFPGAKNPEAFWQLLRDGVDAITEAPAERWDIDALYDPNPATPGKMNTRWGGFLKQVDQFDAQFFGIIPREASSMDPQQRLLLEVAWEAIEDAGQIPERLAKTPTGVFIGISTYDYGDLLLKAHGPGDPYAGTGNTLCIAANRLSYVFDFRGPSLAVDTACSSSLVAVHLACRSLWQGECTMALAGGVNVILSPQININFTKAGFLANDGRCKTFDARANGYVRSEGVGVVILKPLSQALSDGDSIYAVIRGGAVNQDGRTNGLMAPNRWAQEAVVREAYQQAGVQPSQVQYVEAHGTGTLLGDPIEMKALGAVLCKDRSPGQYCAVGSVKTNIGHLEAAAGIAALIKVALSLKHRQIPPSLHFLKPNPHIPFDELPVRVQQTLEPWSEESRLAIAGVSSFGFGGTNAHVVLEEASLESQKAKGKRQNKEAIESPLHLLTLSAKSEKALLELAHSYEIFLAKHSAESIADVCFTTNTGRSHFAHRLAIAAESTEQLTEQLGAFITGDKPAGLVSGHVKSRKRPQIAFLFTGQGVQYPGMGRQLYDTQPTFRKALERCDELLRPYLEQPLLSVLFPASQDSQILNHVETLDVTSLHTQPALFALEYALAELWRSWGIVPDIVMGHSLGEYVAACVAGVFSLEDGLKLIAERGRLTQALPQDGMMAAVFADEARVIAAIVPHNSRVALAKRDAVASIAAVNGPENTVISGDRTTVEAVLEQLRAEGIDARPLQVSHAFHSPLMEPMLDHFQQVAASVKFATPPIPLVSNLTGKILSIGEIPDATYWRRHVGETVQFAAGMHTLAEQGYHLFVEIGPHATLLGMGKHCLPLGSGTWLPSLRKGQDDWSVLLNSLAALYVKGVDVDWAGFNRDYQRSRVHLPTYPFERKRYWIESTETMDIESADTNAKKSDTKSSNPQVDMASKITREDTTSNTTQGDSIRSTLRSLVGGWLQIDPDNVDIYASFLEMGADSIILLEAVRSIENSFGVKVEIRLFFEELTTLDALATYIEQNISSDWAKEGSPQPERDAKFRVSTFPSQHPESEPSRLPQKLPQPIAFNPPVAIGTDKARDTQNGRRVPETALEGIIGQQIQLMSQIMSQQLELLRNDGLHIEQPLLAETKLAESAPAESFHQSVPSANAIAPVFLRSPITTTASPASVSGKTESNQPAAKPSVSAQPTLPEKRDGLSPRQQQYLDTFVARYTKRTQGSKRQKQTYHPVLADKRSASAFRPSIKEMIYPIVGQRSRGSKIWDVDGNEYIDISMGFGVHLFGHAAPFITSAIQEQIEKGIQIGPQSNLAGEVAELICQLTGTERVTFCSTGTEAVMTAIRLARAVTGRTKIALFSGSYHGQSDGVLVLPALTEDGKLYATPRSPGVLPHIVEDTLMLKYGDIRSLDIIKAHEEELAAVLVEPVQASRPNLQPKAFLQELQQLTKASGIALIFDEVITGFRLHPSGAQAWFGVEADIATYGKVVGGGMPIGVVAGKAAYMNAIDGGAWNYGDESYPQGETIFFGGTFNKNPLTMATTRAVLKHLKEQGPELQQQLNQRTSQLAETLNAYFQQENVPIQMIYCGSLFCFSISGNFVEDYSTLEIDLFFYHLIENGVYTWEGRRFFLSTAHTDEDIDFIIRAVKKSVEQIRAGGFLLPKGKQSKGVSSNGTSLSLDVVNPTTPATSCAAQTSGETANPQDICKVPLTEAQKALWFLAQMGEDSSSAYNESMVLQLRGPLNLRALSRVFGQVVNRHESLRTTFSIKGDFQQILPTLTTDLPLIDYSNLAPTERETKVTQCLEKESQLCFDLVQEPLFRIQILKLEQQLHLLVLTVHHLIIDDWSFDVLLHDLSMLYSAECQGTPCQLQSPMQFREYIQWQAQQSQSEKMAADEAYWLNRFAGSIPVLELPTDRPRSPKQANAGASWKGKTLDALLYAGLKRLSQQHGCTLFMTLLAGYFTLLHRLTGQDDIVVGIPVASRSLKNSENLIGYCVNVLPVRSHFVGNPIFTEYLDEVKSLWLEAYKHQDYPFATLVEKLNPARDANQSPIIATVFNMQPSAKALPKFFDLKIDLLPSPISHAKFDLNLSVIEFNNELLVDLDYNSDLFDATTIARMAGHFQTLLESIVAHPEQRLSDLPLLTERERHQILVEWNDTQANYLKDKCIHQIFEAQVERSPDAIAVVFEQQQLTYGELNSRANKIAHHLQALGVKPEVLVGICVERSVEMVVGLLGILKAGGAYVPLDPDYPQERLSYMLSDSQVPVLLTQQRFVARLPQHQAVVICLEKEWEHIAQYSRDNPVSGVLATHLADVIYTSGSTGKPKGVMVTHSGLCNLAQAQIQMFDLLPSSRVLQFASFSFDASISEVVMALGSGATLYLATKDSLLPSAGLIQLLHDYGITHVTLPPSALAVMPVEELPVLQTMIVAGEAYAVELMQQWSVGRRFFNAYGPTEATVCATVAQCTDSDRCLHVPIGHPIPNTQVYILDSYLQPVPVGVLGELHIGGAGLARGYLNRPDLTEEKFIANPFNDDPQDRLYKTGDLARYLSDGNIEYLGRIDHQVKIRGFRIELGEIEAALSQHPDVSQTVVIAREDVPGDKRLVAYVVSHLTPQTPDRSECLRESDGNPIAKLHTENISVGNDLRSFLKQKLPDYMMPSSFVFLNTLPLTPNAKVDRRALPAPFGFHSKLSATSAPQTELEQTIATVWQQVLHVEKVAIDDKFFDLGGHSLLMIRVQSQLEEVLNKTVSMIELFKYPSIRSLSNYLSQGQSAKSSLQHIDRSEKQKESRNQQKQRRLKKA